MGHACVGTRNRRGVQHGCVIGMFLLCLAMELVYARLRVAITEEGPLYTYCDDSYLLAEPKQEGSSHRSSTIDFRQSGIKDRPWTGKNGIGAAAWLRHELVPLPLDNPGVAASHVVPEFAACLGVPRHFNNDQEFITNTMNALGGNHYRLLNMVEDISE
jgi:hypothetical protein